MNSFALADEKRSFVLAGARMSHRGCVLALTGDAEDAVNMITSALSTYNSTGATLFTPRYLSTLAGAYSKLGQFDDAWRCIGEAMTAADLGSVSPVCKRIGDCKDYALAKYFALRQAGVGPDHVSLVIVHNKRHAQDHMVVAAYQDGGWLILDNRTMALVTDVDASSVYLPLFVLDDTGTRRYVL